jgi:hypothetical protein
MRVEVFVTICPTNDRHPRGGLAVDQELSRVDSRQESSGMTTINTGSITTQPSPLSRNTKPA